MWSRLLSVNLSIGACSILASCVSISDAQPQPQQAARTPVPEGINDNFLSSEIDVDEWKSRWQAESREVCANRSEIVQAIGIQPGSTIVDVGAGTGLFVAPFSIGVGVDGVVHAADISPAFVEHLTKQFVDHGIAGGPKNVRPFLSLERSIELPSESVNMAFVCDTYHHFEYHEDMLASIFHALKSGGELILIDFERIPGVTSDWIMGHVRAGKEQVLAEVKAAGFAFTEEILLPDLEENYFLRFQKP